jgi:hypothetical protein
VRRRGLEVHQQGCEAVSGDPRGGQGYDESEVLEAMAEHLECSELRHQILEEGILGQAWPQLAIRSDDELARVQEDGMFKVMVGDMDNNPPDKAFWVTASRTGFWRLHRLGGCGTFRASKPDYEQYDDLVGVTVDARCRHCWPEVATEGSSDDTSSSDSLFEWTDPVAT